MTVQDCEKCGRSSDPEEITVLAADRSHPMHHVAQAIAAAGPGNAGELHLCVGCAYPTMIEPGGGLRELTALELQGLMSIQPARVAMTLVREQVRLSGSACYDDVDGRMPSWEAVQYGRKLVMVAATFGSIPLDAFEAHLRSHGELSPASEAARDKVLRLVGQARRAIAAAKMVRTSSPTTPTAVDGGIVDELRGFMS